MSQGICAHNGPLHPRNKPAGPGRIYCYAHDTRKKNDEPFEIRWWLEETR